VNLLIQRNRMVAAAAFLTALLAVSCVLLPRSFTLTAISDVVTGLLLLIAFAAFASNAAASTGRLRWFWILQATGWGLWFSDQIVWLVYDLILRQKMPSMEPADALLFLAGAPMMAGLLLRPHREPSSQSARLGILDFCLVVLWWVYLYVSLVICWQYLSPNLDAYNQNFDRLSSIESLLLAAVLAVFWLQSSGRWKRFYGAFWIAVVFNGFWFYELNRALEQELYFTGSWLDIPYSGSFAIFVLVAFFGSDLSPVPEKPDNSYNSWMGNLANVAVLSLPILALYALLDPSLPARVSRFRVLVTLATMFLMALLLFLQHRRLNGELVRTNLVLQEASLTDPLTELRNRRFFSATIEADVGQTLRSYSDGRDAHTRDLVFYLIDVDNFKEVNDLYGHDVGDTVLVEIARRLSSSIRHSDILVRWGGEEFLIVSRYTDRADAELLARRVLSGIADTPVSLDRVGKKIYRTCSLGWAAFPWFTDNPRALTYEEVLTLADRGLNRAKQAGKNRAVGMLPASGKAPAITVAGLHSSPLQVDVMATTGPPTTF
jgi:diguanylate cyclase (GGDEF)-like protein